MFQRKGWLLVGNGLESNEVDFEVDVGCLRVAMKDTKQCSMFEDLHVHYFGS